MKVHSRYDVARRLQIFWSLFIGIGAVAGAIGMSIRSDGSAMGMTELLPYFQVLPLAPLLFQSFIFPSIALFCINGLPNLIPPRAFCFSKGFGPYESLIGFAVSGFIGLFPALPGRPPPPAPAPAG